MRTRSSRNARGERDTVDSEDKGRAPHTDDSNDPGEDEDRDPHTDGSNDPGEDKDRDPHTDDRNDPGQSEDRDPHIDDRSDPGHSKSSDSDEDDALPHLAGIRLATVDSAVRAKEMAQGCRPDYEFVSRKSMTSTTIAAHTAMYLAPLFAADLVAALAVVACPQVPAHTDQTWLAGCCKAAPCMAPRGCARRSPELPATGPLCRCRGPLALP